MKEPKKELELLAPAKDLKTGLIAIDAGADAIYIGANKFGARLSASNSLKDIEELVKYAHKFRVKVYVTINTIIYDQEINIVKKLINDLHKIKVDALIIQDMGILEMDLPPIPLIASTQTDNYSLERIKFLEQIGFKRIILARELSLKKIKEIRANTNIELEFFIHGALCVSLSGRCYMSQALSKRSANRGECIQACRLPYKLVDRDGVVIRDEEYLLSLKDLNLSNHLEELIDAGITSFKIEGRLKDEEYVANTVLYYRQKLDDIIKKRNYKKISYGEIVSDFKPNLNKTFNRGYTTYFLKGSNKNILSGSPKSIGELLGKVKEVDKNYFTLDKKHKIENGDGLCFFEGKKMIGSNVNTCEDGKIFLNEMKGIKEGIDIYRNFDKQFLENLRNNFPKRKISVKFIFNETKDGYEVKIEDEEGFFCLDSVKIEKIKANNLNLPEKIIQNQLSKLGETSYCLKEMEINFKNPFVINLSLINKVRRKLIEELDKKRIENYLNTKIEIQKNNIPFYEKEISYNLNVSNKLAENFYKRHEVDKIEKSIETNPKKNLIVMTTKHCIKRYLGLCGKKGLKEPFYLINSQGQKFELEFDCKNCEMKIYKKDKYE